MRRKKVLEFPSEPEEHVPAGFFMIQAGHSRLLFDAQGNKKPPAEVRTLRRPKKAHPKQKGRGQSR
jgi:hypothetical protein